MGCAGQVVISWRVLDSLTFACILTRVCVTHIQKYILVKRCLMSELIPFFFSFTGQSNISNFSTQVSHKLREGQTSAGAISTKGTVDPLVLSTDCSLTMFLQRSM